MIKIKAEINEISNKKTVEDHKTKTQFFEKYSKLDKPLAKLTNIKERKYKSQHPE